MFYEGDRNDSRIHTQYARLPVMERQVVGRRTEVRHREDFHVEGIG